MVTSNLKRVARITVLLSTLLSCGEDSCVATIREKVLPLEIYGVVASKFFDPNQRGEPCYILTDSTKHLTYNIDVYHYIEPGDTVIKKKGTLKFHIKNRNGIREFYPRCGNFDILDKRKY